MTKKPIPIGIEFYKDMIDKNYCYVDKTLFIKELLDQGGHVNLFTRPRRFGKTLIQSMLMTYFEQEIDSAGNTVDNSRYFEGKKIMQAGEEYTSQMGQYPVIFMTLKSAKQPDYKLAYGVLTGDIRREFERHRYVLQKDILTDEQKIQYERFLSDSAAETDYAVAFKTLSECLYAYHKKKAIILLDEYDVPLENAYFCGFYDEMTGFIRSFFESALKTNPYLEFAVITGCLRISKESIFTGLNNLNVNSILTENYAEYFGFIQAEVDDLLTYYGLEEKLPEAKEWYDGYCFGKTEVYNPWSIVKYIYGIIYEKIPYPRPYWANTSSNSIIRELIEKADLTVQSEIENLMAGDTVTKPVHEDITYDEVDKSQDNLWNFMYFTGYLRADELEYRESQIYLKMSIPNKEVAYIYRSNIIEWFRKKVRTMDFTEMYNTILNGDAKGFETAIRKYLKSSISYFDEKEAFYHGFMLGILSAIQKYRVQSNRETGNGRADIVLKPLYEQEPAVILEFKYATDIRQLDAGCDQALSQIEDKNYMEELIEDGYCNIIKYGICFFKKTCKVKSRWDKLESFI